MTGRRRAPAAGRARGGGARPHAATRRGLRTAAATPPATRVPAAPRPAPGSHRSGARARPSVRRGPIRPRVAGGVAGLLAVLAVAGVIAARGPAHRRAGASGTALRTQQTVLFGYGPAGAPATDAALLASDPAQHTSSLTLLPGGLLATDPGAGDTSVGGVWAQGTRDASATVSDLLGVTVDHVWRLSAAGLATVVDRAGGVTLTVDVPVPGPGGTVAIAPGAQRLAGAAAATFAGYLAPSEPEAARLNRLQLVFDALLPTLAGVRGGQVLAGLGGASTTDLAPGALQRFFAGMTPADLALHQQVVPTKALDVGAAAPSYSLDVGGTRALVADVLAASVTGAGTAGGRVIIENNSGAPGLGRSARSRLQAAGLTFVRSENLLPFGRYPRSAVLVFTATAQAMALGHRVAAALGIPAAEVVVSDHINSVADAIAILGPDYRP